MLPCLLLSYKIGQTYIDVINVKSYGEDHQKGELQIIKKDFSHLRDKTVLLIDDQVDTGLTLMAVKEYIEKFSPKQSRLLFGLKKNVQLFTQILL